METLLFWVGVAIVAGLVASIATTCVTLAIAARIEPNDKLQSELRALANDFDDLTEHIARRESRQRVQKMRDGREAKDLQNESREPQPGTPEHKAWLRRLAMSKSAVPHA